ncbi:YecA/YgfB family protein [Pelobacter propionicus]|nr:UPF0149 family protein [Pelobacter propionicus]
MFTSSEKKNIIKLLSSATNQDKIMTLDELHGYLFGLAIIPEMIMPSQWTAAIFGEEESFVINDTIEGEQLFGSLFSAYNRIITDNMTGEFVFPFDIKKDSTKDVNRAREWSRGLYRILSTSKKIFKVYDEIKKGSDNQSIDNETFAVCYCILKAVAYPEKTPELLERLQKGVRTDIGPVISDANFISMLPAAVVSIREYAMVVKEVIKNSETSTTINPSSPLQVVKIGRNDPCPCGSGIKYKKCCGK